jgi:hypothetical protein
MPRSDAICRRPIRSAAAFTSVAIAAVILAGCSEGGPETTIAPPVQPHMTSAPTPAPATYPDVIPTTGPAVSVIPPDIQGAPAPSSTVAGLDQGIESAAHASLTVCGGHYASVVAGRGDLSSRGQTEYLVDTTCAGSTGASPDEVALYGLQGRGLARVGMIYEYTVNRPRITDYPFLAGPHLVVLEYGDGAQFSLVGLSASGITQGPLENA